MLAADLVSRSVVAISPDALLAQANRVMIDHRVSMLPVIDAEGRAAGVLTKPDLLQRVETVTEGEAPGLFASSFSLDAGPSDMFRRTAAAPWKS